MILATDAALATFTAGLLFAVYALGKSIRGAVAILLPFAAAVLTFVAVAAALALLFGFGAASGGVGHTPTATNILRGTLLAVAAGMGLIVGVCTVPFADRWASPGGDDDEGSASPACARRRRVRLGLAVLIGIGAFPAWHEYRLWSAVEIAGRSSDPRGNEAIGRLAQMKDPRAFAALKRLAGRDLGALQAMGIKGEPGKKALLEYLRTSPSPDWRAAALSSLCMFRDADVVATVRQSLADRNVQIRVAGIRCLARILSPPEAVELLKPFLDDEALEAREAASDELGHLGDPSGSVPKW